MKKIFDILKTRSEQVVAEEQPLESKKKGFTLAETLITLTILGVVAAITIPALINKYIETTNRTKVRKAMAAYEKALNQMIVENNISGSIKSIFPNGNCTESSKNFKVAEFLTEDKCRFRTEDGIIYDIYDLEHPIIILSNDYKTTALDGTGNLRDLAKGDNEDVFGMVGTIEDGIVRINDKGAASGDDATILNKTYAFANNEVANSGTIDPNRTCSDSTKNANGVYVSCKTSSAESGGQNDYDVYGPDGEHILIDSYGYCDYHRYDNPADDETSGNICKLYGYTYCHPEIGMCTNFDGI